MKTNAKTLNNANAYDHSYDHLLEFFSKAGSAFVKAKKYYNRETPVSALALFKAAWITGQYEKCMQLLFWCRDIRSGAGNRSGPREILKWLGENEPVWVTANIHLIPEYGRWDDLKALYNTFCQDDALKLWASAINNGNGLAAKWADRQDNVLRRYMKLSPKQYRKLLVKNTNVVETAMCQNQWDTIDYNKVPSVASARYTQAFKRHDMDRYNKWRQSLVSNESRTENKTKINTGAIYPHDIIRTYRSDKKGNKELVQGQFELLPNYFGNSQKRIIPILDFSGSMTVTISGFITAMDIALGLGLYCSDRIGKENPFYRKLIPFSSESKLECWDNMTVAEAIDEIPNGYVGSTDIYKALINLLEAGKLFNVKKEDMPNMLLIISDMQFDFAVTNKTPVQAAMDEWVEAGYNKPSIVFWNLNPYDNQPATCKDSNVALVSGFSPSIMESILSTDDFTPIGIMLNKIKNYKVVVP